MILEDLLDEIIDQSIKNTFLKARLKKSLEDKNPEDSFNLFNALVQGEDLLKDLVSIRDNKASNN